MACILLADEEDVARKINIDDLYEKNQRRDLKQVSIFNKILNRVHKRITTISRNTRNEKHIWFVVPEFIFGEPIYDKSECIAYVVSKLEENGFFIKFMYPSTLFISWDNWVPAYKRTEIKKKLGLVIDERGNVIDKIEKDQRGDGNNLNSGMFNNKGGGEDGAGQKDQKQFKSINQYKPTGNFIYDSRHLEKIDSKVNGGR